jgi:hypothetical protein
MTRGRYAERSRHKREADVRYAMALKEADETRAKLQEVRTLREEVRQLKEANQRLRTQIRESAAPEVERLEAKIQELMTRLVENDRYVADIMEKWSRAVDYLVSTMPGDNTKGHPGIAKIEGLGRALGLLGDEGLITPGGSVVKGDYKLAKLIRQAQSRKKANPWTT